MDDNLAAAQTISLPLVASSLLERPAAYSVIEELLRVQETMEPRSLLRRIFGSRPIRSDARSWFSGALGELRVGELLAKLGPEWTVLHAVPVGQASSDIDHLVIGPAGVFSINTKHHPGKKVWVGDQRLLIAGRKTDHLRNSRHEAIRAAKLLTQAAGVPVSVHPIVAIVESAPFPTIQRLEDVSVMEARALPRWLKRRAAKLEPEHLARIVRVATNVRTWHPTAVLSIDPAYRSRFRELQREDTKARVIRIIWGASALIAASLLAYFFALPALTAALIAGVGAL